MIWLTSRQFRSSFAVAAVSLMLIFVALAAADPGSDGYFSRHHLVQFFSTLLVGVPALIGAFWGAPLIGSELEAGTYRLAWTQSVTRTRWLAVKVTLIGLAGVAITELLALTLSGWSTSSDSQNRFSPNMFAQRGIAPMGYTLFGFALGIAVGLVLRRTLPAMASTLVAFLAIRLVVQNLVRPRFASPLKISAPLTVENGSPLQARPGDWSVSNNFVDSAGHIVSNIPCDGSQHGACIASYHQVLTYQPASRYWTFQGYELAIFCGLGLILIGFSFWWIRHRIS
jgi:ABC-type transport system involved in multi-copper enzyme maturation permease subunit